MKQAFCITLFLVAGGSSVAEEAKSRTFRFTYAVTVIGLEAGQEARVWLPVPPTTDDQTIAKIDVDPSLNLERGKEPKYGNEMFFLKAKADKSGMIPIRIVYTVTRKEICGETDKELTANLDKFLKPDALAPPTGKHLRLLEGNALPADQIAAGRQLYDLVNDMMRYAKEGTEWGRGDVNWVCDSKFGNCTDFHGLFTALMRSQKIPSKFEIGFGLPPARGKGEIAGYHCWAKFKPEGKGWIPVDISEANKNPKLKDYYFGNLTEDRITFSTGRDLVLEPKQAGPPLNFFVYPYVEVANKPLPADRIKKAFSFEDALAKP